MQLGRLMAQHAAAWRGAGEGEHPGIAGFAAASAPTSSWAADRWNASEPVGGSAGAKAPKPSVVSMPSPNQSSRPAGAKIDTIVLHHTAGGGTAQGVGNFFKNPGAQVSSHYIVGKDGTIVQPVADSKAAWHAGVSEFKGRERVNDFSIGIEIVNRGDGKDPYTDAQYKALAKLVAYLQTEYGIPRSRITGHKDVARPRGRKVDPSSNFSYDRLTREVDAILKGERSHAPDRSKPKPRPDRDPRPKPTSNATPEPSPAPVFAPPPAAFAPAPTLAPVQAVPLPPPPPLAPPPPPPPPPPMPAALPPVIPQAPVLSPSVQPLLGDPQPTAMIGQLMGELVRLQAELERLIASQGQPGATLPAPSPSFLASAPSAPLPGAAAPSLPVGPAGAAVASVPG